MVQQEFQWNPLSSQFFVQSELCFTHWSFSDRKRVNSTLYIILVICFLAVDAMHYGYESWKVEIQYLNSSEKHDSVMIDSIINWPHVFAPHFGINTARTSKRFNTFPKIVNNE